METLTPQMAEYVEAEYMFRSVAATPSGDRVAERLGGGVVTALPHSSSRYWTKALGFGFTEPVTEGLLERVVGRWREAGVRAGTLQLAPAALPDDWEGLRARFGLTPSGSWYKLYARTDQVVAATTQLRVAAVSATRVDEWARIVLTTFGMSVDELGGMLTASTAHPGVHPFAAFDGDTMVAAALVSTVGEVASLHAAATLPGYRGRGAQSALLTARVARARELGCRWIVAETGVPAPGETNTSLDNLRRAGLEPLYERPNFGWQDRPSPR